MEGNEEKKGKLKEKRRKKKIGELFKSLIIDPLKDAEKIKK